MLGEILDTVDWGDWVSGRFRWRGNIGRCMVGRRDPAAGSPFLDGPVGFDIDDVSNLVLSQVC